jgi:starch-binding outer membrane protein, SusD/RagB family
MIPMKLTRIIEGLGAIALVALAGCNSLDVSNPNEPDAQRALSDPATIEAVAAGAMRTWFNAYTSLRGAGVLVTQAKSYSSSWNNGNLNFYSSIDNPTDPPANWTRATTPRSWQNDPAAAARTSVDAFWGGGLDESGNSRGGMYSALSSANDALTAIRINKVTIRTDADTKRAEAIAAFMQGASLMVVALNFDKGYVVDEKTDLVSLQYSNRAVVRDSAVSKLTQAAALAAATTFVTPADWAHGITYTSAQIAQIANTMAAMTLAYWPRDNTELAKVDWAKVVSFTSKGMSAGTPVDFNFIQDGYSQWISEVQNWFVEMDTGRMDTRVAHFLDPATQKDPWPDPNGNPQPNSPDKRLGDGTFGNTDTRDNFGTIPKTSKAGTDYAWSGVAIFRPARGQYHQSNIGHIRYDVSGTQDVNAQYGGYGLATVISATLNDLLWAEALLRQGSSNANTAVTLINKTRVTRGGLSSSGTNAGVGSDADGPCMANGLKAKDGTACTLWSMLIYEKEVELPGLGAASFWEERRLPNIIGGGFTGDNSPRRLIQGLLPGTPRELPVPYKELGVKGQALYTWGGATPNSPVP